jgi:hypothetical protein
MEREERAREREIRAREREERAKIREIEREAREKEREERSREREMERDARSNMHEEQSETYEGEMGTHDFSLGGVEYVPSELADLYMKRGDKSLESFRGMGSVTDVSSAYMSCDHDGVKCFMGGLSVFLSGKWRNIDLRTRTISPLLNYAFEIIGYGDFILDNFRFREPLRISRNGHVTGGKLLYDVRD